VAILRAGVRTDVNGNDLHLGMGLAVPRTPVATAGTNLEHRANGRLPPGQERVHCTSEVGHLSL